MQVVEQAVKGAGGTDDAKLADFMRKSTFKTVVGDIKLQRGGRMGDRAGAWPCSSRASRATASTSSRDPKTEVILWPDKYKTGNIIYPYDPKK